MKPTTVLSIFVIAGGIAAGIVLNRTFPSASVSAAPAAAGREDAFAAQWRAVDSLTNLGLTESALAALDKLYHQAKKGDVRTMVVKALLYRMRLESYKEEQSTVKALGLFEKEAREASGPLRAILHSAAAELYWRYYEENRWRFFDRSKTAAVDANDVTTWDLSAIVAATVSHYEASLDDRAELRKQSLEAYKAILLDFGNDAARRPTLYDFLAHRAADFFMSAESGLPRPSYAFQIDKADYFARCDAFASLPLSTRDSLSFAFRALSILRELTAFHKSDDALEALVDIECKRLEFVHEHATLEAKDSLYLAALEALRKKCGKDSAAAEVMHAIASVYADQGSEYKPEAGERYKWRNKQAVGLCDSAIRAFSKSYGACLCAELKSRLCAKTISIDAEEVTLPGKPFRVRLSWKNIPTVWLRAIPIDVVTYKKFSENIPYSEDEKNRKLEEAREAAKRGTLTALDFKSDYDRLVAMKPAAEWSIGVPDDGDLQPHSAEVKAPALPRGHYALLVSAKQGFPYSENGIALGHCWVSRIAYFGRRIGGSYELYVRDRESGGPLADVAVTKMDRVYNETERVYTFLSKETYTADAEGRVSLPPSFSRNSHYAKSFAIRIVAGKDTLVGGNEIYADRASGEREPYLQTFFFTDRAIYRPGQTIYFKGIVLKRAGDKSAIVPRRETVVEFSDVNGQKVSSLALTTNGYGAVSGSFTAPSGGLTGQMSIHDQWGSVFISVEEYKRPKFEVTVNPVKGSYRLNESVTVTGRAKAYTGAANSGGTVAYRVVRSTNFPYRFDWWYCRRPPSPAMEIAYGSTMTNDTGGFSVTFTAIPDGSVSRDNKPTFLYTVSIDVTDRNGETRSASAGVTVGYTALDVSLDIPPRVEKTKDTAFAIKATNLSGTPEPTKGTVRIFRLKGPPVPTRSRVWEKPDRHVIDKKDFAAAFPGLPYDGEDNPSSWPREKMVFETAFDTKTDSLLVPKDLQKWLQGVYAAEVGVKDAFGQELKTTRYFVLFSVKDKEPPAPLCDWFVPITLRGEPGEKATFLAGTAEKDARVLLEIEHKGEIAKKEWFSLSNGQKLFEIPIEEKHRGNFAVHFIFIKNSRVYRHDEVVTVPWTNKELSFAFETFRDKLAPGDKEEWRIKISGKKKDKVAAEMVAAMYDASLDAFAPHAWNFDINPTYGSGMSWDTSGQFGSGSSLLLGKDWNPAVSCREIRYPLLNWFGFGDGYYSGRGMLSKSRVHRARSAGIGYGAAKSIGRPQCAPPPPAASVEFFSKGGFADGIDAVLQGANGLKSESRESNSIGYADAEEDLDSKHPKETKIHDLSSVKSRVNLNETAFFFPHLTTNEKGDVVVSFTAPEALTRWKLLGFAHTADLRYGSVEKELVTRKLLMTVPNLPRFLREGDTITLAAKVTNLSDGDLSGAAQLFLFDATTRKPVDSAFGLRTAVTDVSIKKGQSALVCWELRVPEGVPAVAVRIAAKAGDYSDAEETTLPLLTNRTLVTETMPLPLRTKGTASFTLQKLVSSGGRSSTLRHHKLTLEFTQNPAWYAVQALPYLMEYPYECAEQTFSRYYANTIASGIANSTPKIKAVFDSWRSISPNALLSNLEKNQELKSALLEETPWVLDGKNESENKRRVALLFDLNKMSNELALARGKLQKMQLSNGGWPWFDGMPDDRFITQYIVTGLGRLLHLNMISFEADGALKEMVEQGLRYCDRRVREDYESVLKSGSPDSNHLGCTQIQYLYARSYFPNVSIDDANKKAFEYYKRQATKYWLRNNRYLQGMIALSLNRMGEKEVPSGIIRSLKENSLASAEMGMYWKEAYEGHWYDSPIEMQALFIEAFDEVARDSASVDAMKVWLLKSKQTQNWKTTKATAEACYALLLRGADWLARDGGVTVTLGSRLVDPKKLEGVSAEAGTGYFKTSWSGREIEPSMGNVKVTKTGQGVSWGALYWQYFEQLDKITQAATPLKLSKKLFIKRNTDRGPALDALAPGASCAVGDKITVRIELRADRDLEYVHLKDMRASGFEPLNVLSGYRWRDGLGYYESTRDAASHFFIAYLQKGTYVFEYDLVVAHEGRFSNGISSVQCMYAPEFSSHSEGIRVRVGK